MDSRLSAAGLTLAAFAAGLLGSLPAWADDLQQWSSVTVEQALDDDFTASLMTQLRFDDDISRLDVLLLRPAVEYRIADQAWVALGYDWLHRPPASVPSEQRTWQQLRLPLSAGDLSLESRLRLEERFIEDTDGATLRLRYRLQIKHPLPRPDWQVITSNEALFNLNHQDNGPARGFVQNRLFAGVELPLGSQLQLKTGYLWRLRPNTSDHILVLAFTWTGK